MLSGIFRDGWLSYGISRDSCAAGHTLDQRPQPLSSNGSDLCAASPPAHVALQVLSWMEQCAYISASRLRASHILTAAMDSVSFAKSTKVGDIMYITSQVGSSAHGERCSNNSQAGCTAARITAPGRHQKCM